MPAEKNAALESGAHYPFRFPYLSLFSERLESDSAGIHVRRLSAGLRRAGHYSWLAGETPVLQNLWDCILHR
jgi:hypothetical protein